MSTYEARLNALRVQLKKDRLDGFVVPCFHVADS